MLISKKEKQECKIKIEACQTTNELIDLVYDLYINHKYNYYNLRTVLRQVYPNCETKDVSNLFNDLNVKRCANNENCIDLKGPIKTKEEFSINTSTMDGRNTICRLCERYKKFHRKLDDESKYNIELYHSFKTQEERDDCIIQLYSSLKYTFNELLNITLLDGDYLRALFKKKDIKVCTNGENCKDVNGPIKSQSLFPIRKDNHDGLNYSCIFCHHFNSNYKNADQEKKQHMDNFHSLNNFVDRENYIYDLYVNQDKGYSYIIAVTLWTTEQVVDVFKKLDIKRCSQRENCKNFEGAIQSRSNFQPNDLSNDSIHYVCHACQRFYQNYKYSDYIIRQYMDKFHSLKTLKKRENYIYELYVNYEETVLSISKITYNSVNNITKILEKFDVKRCCMDENCVSPYGSTQSRKNFVKDQANHDGYSYRCKFCVQEYDNSFAKFDTFAHKIQLYHKIRRDPEDQNLIQVRCKLCKKWFNPTTQEIRLRVRAINGSICNIGTENNMYCSETCKNNCPLYKKQILEILNDNKFDPDNKKENYRIQSTIRKFVISKFGEPDHCEKCGKSKDVSELELHHIEPVAISNILEADVDNLIWLCSECHINSHHIDGCRSYELSEPIYC